MKLKIKGHTDTAHIQSIRRRYFKYRCNDLLPRLCCHFAFSVLGDGAGSRGETNFKKKNTLRTSLLLRLLTCSHPAHSPRNYNLQAETGAQKRLQETLCYLRFPSGTAPRVSGCQSGCHGIRDDSRSKEKEFYLFHLTSLPAPTEGHIHIRDAIRALPYSNVELASRWL